MGADKLVDVWIMSAFGRNVDVMLLDAVCKACELRDDRSVTSGQVAAQLPSPFPEYWPKDVEWDLRSVAQRLRALADRGVILRVGMRADTPGTPPVQHWWAPPGSVIESARDRWRRRQREAAVS